MANAVYPKYKKASHSGGANCDLLAGTVKIIMVDLGNYTYDAAHEFLSDVPSAARIGITGALTSKTVTDGAAFQSANGSATGVTGASVEALIGYIDTGSPTTSRLVWYDDTTITGLPVTPGGENYTIVMDSSGWCIF